MKNTLERLFLLTLFSVACAHKSPEAPDTSQPIGSMQNTDKSFVLSDPDSKQGCKADSECPLGDFCHPEQLICFQSYPHPRMLDVSSLDQECKIVNVYFPYDSTELVPEAQRWLDYDLRCFKSRGVKRLLLEGFGDARGSQGYNLKLSERRAAYVKQVLTEKGSLIPLEVLGEGKRHPLRSGTSEKDYAFNRRVEFKVE